MTRIDTLIRLIEKDHFGIFIMSLFELAAIVTGLRYVRRDKTSAYFLAYLILDFTLLWRYVCLTLSPLNSPKSSILLPLFNTLSSWIELLAYYYFFIQVIQYSAPIKVMKLIRIFFIAVVLIFIPTRFTFLSSNCFYVSDFLTVLEFLCILPPCLVYFYELFQKVSLHQLEHRPSFWILTGVFFYVVISVPYYLVDHYISINHYERRSLLYLAFFFIPYSISFIFLTKAFLCKTTLTI